MSIDRHWLEELLARSIEPKGMDAVLNLPVGNSRIRLIARPLNPDSSFPAAHEVFVASLSSLGALQARSRLQIIGAGAVLFLIGLAFSHTISSRFSRPVEALAEESENQRVERLRAETRLEETSEELRRAARFSADASHQLKTPVSVMRVGLEELLNFGQLKKPHREEVQSLIRQTDRLTQVIDDLLLLSRMDSGGLKLTLGTQQLKRLVEALVDDLSMLPDAGSIELCLEIPEDLYVRGDRGYTMQIFQCALENAWKYNRPGGRIVIRATRSGEAVSCRIGNTGRGISAENQAHIFDRFHRATLGEDVPGYGLGLNLARDLAQLHGGDLRLLSSAEDWTEFEVLLRAAAPESGERT